MSVSLYRYGSARRPGEGLRIGVARRTPRGVRRETWSAGGWFDTWLPLLAPSAPLVREYVKRRISLDIFRRAYRLEMKRAECVHVIRLLGAVSLVTPVSLGCFCEEEAVCHRSLLRELVLESPPPFPRPAAEGDGAERFTSPVCLCAAAEKDLL